MDFASSEQANSSEHSHVNGGDPSRKKVVKACDRCQKKKIKCNGTSAPCSNCAQRNVECTFTHVEKSRKTPRKSAKRIAELDRRLNQLEELLKSSSVLAGGVNPANRLKTNEQRSLTRSGNAVGQKSSNLQENSDSSTSQPTSVASSSLPRERIDRIQGLSRFTPRALNGAGVTREVTTSAENEFTHWDAEILDDSFRRRVDLQLPPIHEALAHLQLYFENFNCVIPLFHQKSFMQRASESYTRERQGDPAWWGALNVALSLAHRLRAMSTAASRAEDELALGYLQNALRVVSELTLRDNTDLLGVQAMLGMAIILQATPNWRPASFLVAAATRLLYNLGLHKNDPSLQLNSVDAEQRNRLFWIAYLLDKDLCLQLDQPPVLNDEEIYINLPCKSPADGLGFIFTDDGSASINYFRLRTELAVIQSKTYNRLYSAKALKQSASERSESIRVLDLMVKNWKSKIPPPFQPEFLSTHLSNYSTIHMAILHLFYFNCFTLIHGVSFSNYAWRAEVTKVSQNSLEGGVCGSSQRHSLVVAARSSLRLLELSPHGDYACIWLLLRSHVSSLVIILASALQCPQFQLTPSDTQLVHSSLHLLQHLAQNANTPEITRIHTFCTDLARKVWAVQGASDTHSETTQTRKRVLDASELLELSKTSGDPLSFGWLDRNANTSPNIPSPSTDSAISIIHESFPSGTFEPNDENMAAFAENLSGNETSAMLTDFEIFDFEKPGEVLNFNLQGSSRNVPENLWSTQAGPSSYDAQDPRYDDLQFDWGFQNVDDVIL